MGLAILPTPARTREFHDGCSLFKAGANAYLASAEGALYRLLSEARELRIEEHGRGEMLGVHESAFLFADDGRLHCLDMELPPLKLAGKPLAAARTASNELLISTPEWEIVKYRLKGASWVKAAVLYTGDQFLCRITALRALPEANRVLMAGAHGVFCGQRVKQRSHFVPRFPWKSALRDPRHLHLLENAVVTEASNGLHVFSRVEDESMIALEAMASLKKDLAWVTQVDATRFLLQESDSEGRSIPQFCLWRVGEESPRSHEGFAALRRPGDASLYVLDPAGECLRCASIHRLAIDAEESLWQVDVPLDDPVQVRGMLALNGILVVLTRDRIITIGELEGGLLA